MAYKILAFDNVAGLCELVQIAPNSVVESSDSSLTVAATTDPVTGQVTYDVTQVEKFVNGASFNPATSELTIQMADGTTYVTDLSALAGGPDVKLNTVVLDTPGKVINFTLSDGTVIPLDVTDLFDNTNTSISSGDGSVTITQTANPDGSPNYDLSVVAGADTHIQSAVYDNVTKTVTITETDATAFPIDISALDTNTSITSGNGSVTITQTANPDGSPNYDLSVASGTDVHTQSLAYNNATKTLTLTETNATAFPVDLSALDTNTTITSAGGSVTITQTANPDGSPNYDLSVAAAGGATNLTSSVNAVAGTVSVFSDTGTDTTFNIQTPQLWPLAQADEGAISSPATPTIIVRPAFMSKFKNNGGFGTDASGNLIALKTGWYRWRFESTAYSESAYGYNSTNQVKVELFIGGISVSARDYKNWTSTSASSPNGWGTQQQLSREREGIDYVNLGSAFYFQTSGNQPQHYAVAIRSVFEFKSQ